MMKQDLVLLSKKGINTFVGLGHYIEDAVYQAKNHNLVSAISRDEWIAFNSFNPYTRHWNHYEAILEQNLKKFDLYLVYENTKRQIGSVPVSDVLSTSKMKKFGLPVKDTDKSTTKKSVSKSKSDTARTTKRSTTRRSKHTIRRRKGRTARKPRTRKAKK